MYLGSERRRNRRYIVRGTVTFSVAGRNAAAELVNFGWGGMLVRSPLTLSEGTSFKMRVMAYCYPYAFDVVCRAVGKKDRLVALAFEARSQGVAELLQWLAQEHFPWTGTFTSGNAPVGEQRAESLETGADGEIAEDLIETYQLA